MNVCESAFAICVGLERGRTTFLGQYVFSLST